MNIRLGRWHRYEVEKTPGKWEVVPSVTQIIGMLDKPALVPWAGKITANYVVNEVLPLIQAGELVIETDEDYEGLFQKAKVQAAEESKKAKDVGTEVHDAIHRYCLIGEKPTELSPQAQQSFQAYLDWEAKARAGKILAMEMPFYNDDYDFCGTFDRLGFLNGKLYLIDYKSSKSFYEPDMPLQLAAYRIGVNKMIKNGELESKKMVEGAGVLRLDKETGEPFWKDYTLFLDTAEKFFLVLREAYGLKKDLGDIAKGKMV